MTRAARRFLALPAAERALLVRAVLLLAAVRLGLSVLPLGALEGRTSRNAVRAAGRRVSAARIGWAVETAGRYVPGATCLVRALAAVRLAARHGHASHLRIGVRKGGAGAFEAHAWVESGGAVLTGGSAREGFRSLQAVRG